MMYHIHLNVFSPIWWTFTWIPIPTASTVSGVLFSYFKTKLWFFKLSREINLDLNLRGKRWLEKTFFYLSICYIFAAVLYYFKIVLIKTHSLMFIFRFYTKDDNSKSALCGYILTQMFSCIIWRNRQFSGQWADRNFLSSFSHFLVCRCFFVSDNQIKISVYGLTCIILA